MFIKNKKINIKKKLIMTASATTLMASVSPSLLVSAKGPEVDAKASITVDYETGKILQGNNIDEPLGIASITKMIVEYIVFEEIEAGNIDWDTKIKISDYAHDISQNYVLSNVPLKIGEDYSLEELYQAMAIYSANGATIAIAEAISGSESEFVDRMKETVKSFGVEDAKIYNSTGLNNSYLKDNIYPGSNNDDENSMSAKSIAIIANQIIQDYPEVLETASISKKTFREGTEDEIEMKNWNWMLEGLLLEKPGVDGLKTGTTDFAGSTFTGTAFKEERRLITVVLDSGEDTTTRFKETAKLMDYGFDHFNNKIVTDNWDENLDYQPLSVIEGKEEELNYEPSKDLEMLIQLNDKVEDLTFAVEWNEEIVSESGTIEAPISKGTELGNLVVSDPNNEWGYIGDGKGASVSLIAKENVEQAGIFSRLWTRSVDFFKDIKNRF
ncbi:MAG: D-alanyl-D-alanine carboxypeptidase [Atopostipes suicloacalis]|nr:D-alanyl-D-alanine carboxypeptidase [Atopostipes suicloacalis]